MKLKILLLACCVLTSLLYINCNKNNTPTEPVDTINSEINQKVVRIQNLQENNSIVLKTLFSKVDSLSAVDSVVSIISRDTSVSFCSRTSEGIIIQYKSGIRGCIFFNPEDDRKRTSINKSQGDFNFNKLRVLPGSKSTIFIDAIENDLYGGILFSLESFYLSLVGYDVSVNPFYFAQDANVDLFTHLSPYGIIHIHSHSLAFVDTMTGTPIVTDVYLKTGEHINDKTTNKYQNEISNLHSLLLGTDMKPKRTYYFINSDFIGSKNNFTNNPLIYGEFCNSYLAQWPEKMTNKGALAYIGYDEEVRDNKSYDWAESIFYNLTDKTLQSPMTIDYWFTQTTIPKSYYDEFRCINVNIKYLGNKNLKLWSIVKINPNPISGVKNDDIKLTVDTKGTAPKNANYIWNFGDGSPEVTKTNDNVVIHKFSSEGNYSVKVKLYNNSNNELEASDNATANITVCPNIAGKWYFTDSGTITQTIGGQSQTQSISQSGTVNIVQNGNDISWTVPGTNYIRKGSINGRNIQVSGIFGIPVSNDVVVTKNIFTATGTISTDNRTINMQGTGKAEGTYSGQNFIITGNDNAVFTKSGSATQSMITKNNFPDNSRSDFFIFNSLRGIGTVSAY